VEKADGIKVGGMSSAIIIPEMTDLNRGDQALIWEAIRLLRESEIISSIALLEEPRAGKGANPQIVQSRKRAEEVLEVILKHPARGTQSTAEIQPGLQRRIFMGARGGYDWFRMRRLLQNVEERKWRHVWKGLSGSERRTIEAFVEAQAIIVKGGGAFHAYSSSAYWEYYLWYNSFHIFLALALNKRVVVLPNSFGPFPGRRIRRVVRNAFSRVEWLAARESISAEVLGKVLGRNVAVKTDLGFFLRPRYSSRVDAILREWRGTDVVTVTVRPWRFPGNRDPEGAYLRYIRSIAEVIDWARSEGLRPVVVPHCLGPGAHEDDRKAIGHLSSLMGEESLEVANTEGMDCEEVAALYGAAIITVGTRFHSVVFSLAQGTPSLAIGYGGNKAKGILADLGLAQWYLPIEKAEGRKVVGMTQDLLASKIRVRRTLVDIREKFANDRSMIKEEIKEVLKG
jgi:colanic acid/amylovoran biosynthesis protein